ncbi:hypothetical protein ACHAQH_001686 [Verticillium albo-atrum]
MPPEYHTDIDLAAVWELKMELEDAVDRADDRTWHTVIVELRGTSLKLYSVKKEWTQWGWGAAREWASSIQSPDNPPWARRATLLRTYHLQHADIGIAADYKKRRNVIRLRLETDQLLLSCLEPATFVRWLDAFFAAIAVAAPLDERSAAHFECRKSELSDPDTTAARRAGAHTEGVLAEHNLKSQLELAPRHGC